MIKFHTEIHVEDFLFKLNHNDCFFTTGSCFANHIANKLLHYKHLCISNPFGTSFHPIPLFENLINCLQQKSIDSKLFVFRDDAFFHHSYHSSLWALSQNELLQNLYSISHEVKVAIEKAKLIIITLGSAFLYRISSSGKAVANCHKISSRHFTKNMSTPNEIKDAFIRFYEILKNKNPKVNILLSVSPVRHLKEGLHQNNLSKASLLLACNMIKDSFSDVHYFPAYEIMMDELRDYRFFKKDMIHPNEESVNYIWQKFSQVFLSDKAIHLNQELDRLYASINHRAYRNSSFSHQSFLKKTLKHAKRLNEKVRLDAEINDLKSRIL